jgi:hypothetical protein
LLFEKISPCLLVGSLTLSLVKKLGVPLDADGVALLEVNYAPRDDDL